VFFFLILRIIQLTPHNFFFCFRHADKNGAELALSLSQPLSLFLFSFLESGARSVDRRFFLKLMFFLVLL